MNAEDIALGVALVLAAGLLVLALVVGRNPEKRQVGTFQSTVKITP